MRSIWWLTAITLISVLTIFLSERRSLDPVQNLSLTVTAPVSTSLRDAVRPVDDLFKGVTDRDDLVRENRKLKEQIAALQQDLAQRQDAEQRVRDLEQALGATQARPEDQLLAASVIAEDTAALKRMIAIDRGSSAGIDEGMVVLSPSGSLVGTVARAYDDYSWVRLITDPESAVNAQLSAPPAPATPSPAATPAPTPGPSPAATPPPAPPAAPTPQPEPLRGVAEGDLRREIILDLLPSDIPVAEGSLVSTSGLGGNYPRALLIGTVQSVERRPQSPFTIADVNPAANLSALDTVLVVTNFQPARLTDQ
jgi:rod shape-determining protein MreC